MTPLSALISNDLPKTRSVGAPLSEAQLLEQQVERAVWVEHACRDLLAQLIDLRRLRAAVEEYKNAFTGKGKV